MWRPNVSNEVVSVLKSNYSKEKLGGKKANNSFIFVFFFLSPR